MATGRCFRAVLHKNASFRRIGVLITSLLSSNQGDNSIFSIVGRHYKESNSPKRLIFVQFLLNLLT